jgi:hypothetical protein
MGAPFYTPMGQSSDVTITCLRCIPSLEAISIQNTEYPDYDWELLFALLIREDGFLPALNILALSGYIADISSVSLVGMLASRCNGTRAGVSNLVSLHFGSPYEDYPTGCARELRDQLRLFTDEGLDLTGL